MHQSSGRSAARPGSSWWLCLLAALCAATVAAASVNRQDDESDVRLVVLEAIELMGEDLQTVSGDYRALVTSEAREFDGSGEVAEETRVEWESVPIDGGRFRRRLAIDSRPLTEAERARESEREAAFRTRLRRLRAGEIEPEENETAIVFDEELVSRYALTLDGEEPLRRRPSHRIAFAPRDGDLPVRRGMDRALNRLRGRIWIDRETREVARVEFELMDRVRLWWGLVGTIHHVRGSFDRGPVLDGSWGILQNEVYTDIRVLFSRSRQASIQRWRNYAWAETHAAGSASDGGNPHVDDVVAR